LYNIFFISCINCKVSFCEESIIYPESRIKFKFAVRKSKVPVSTREVFGGGNSRGRISDPFSYLSYLLGPSSTSIDAIEFLHRCKSIVPNLAVLVSDMPVHSHTDRPWKIRAQVRGIARPLRGWRGEMCGFRDKKGGWKGKKKRGKCLTRAMHNGERGNPLAGVPWNKYVPFVLVKGEGEEGGFGRPEREWKESMRERERGRRPRENRGRRRTWQRGRLFRRRRRRRRRRRSSTRTLHRL